jgi:hypothetical protein
MDKQKVLALVGLGFIAFTLAKGVGNAAYQNIVFTPGNASFDSSQLVNNILRIRWNVTITNNNPINATLNDVKGTVFYGQIAVGNVDILQPALLETGIPKSMVLIFDIHAQQLIQDVIASFGSQGAWGTLLNQIRFKGTIYTSLINIPIDTVIQLF